MATVADLMPGAFYMAKAGGLSKQGGQLPSVAQTVDALAILNRILDALSLEAEFNSFMYQLVIPNPSTRKIFIGRNLTPEAGVTIIDADPFKLIFGASVTNPLNPYPLIIQDIVELTKVPFSVTEGTPGYLYYGIAEQDNNIYTEISLYPSPNQTGDISLTGIKVLPSTQTLPDNVLSTFFLYLQYRVAKQLAREYGTMTIWNEGGYDQDLDEYKDIIGRNSPVNASPNDLTTLLDRSYYGNYPWY